MNLAELQPMTTYYAWSARKRGMLNALPIIVLDNHYWYAAAAHYKYDSNGRLITMPATFAKGRKLVDYMDVDACGIPVMWGSITPRSGYIDARTEWTFQLVAPSDILSNWDYASAYQQKELADKTERDRVWNEKVLLVNSTRDAITECLTTLGITPTFTGDGWSNGVEASYGFRLDSGYAEQFLRVIKGLADQENRIHYQEEWQARHQPIIDMITEVGIEELNEYIADYKYEMED